MAPNNEFIVANIQGNTIDILDQMVDHPTEVKT